MGLPIRVEVTQRDIDKGYANSCKSCPVALALRRVFHTAKVDVDSFFITIKGHHHMVTTDVLSFMSDFDRGLRVKPFTFFLEVQ